jgi:hypothetical protein
MPSRRHVGGDLKWPDPRRPGSVLSTRLRITSSGDERQATPEGSVVEINPKEGNIENTSADTHVLARLLVFD